jgi:hypothetical protein
MLHNWDGLGMVGVDDTGWQWQGVGQNATVAKALYITPMHDIHDTSWKTAAKFQIRQRPPRLVSITQKLEMLWFRSERSTNLMGSVYVLNENIYVVFRKAELPKN